MGLASVSLTVGSEMYRFDSAIQGHSSLFKITTLGTNYMYLSFLQRVRIARNAERCTS